MPISPDTHRRLGSIIGIDIATELIEYVDAGPGGALWGSIAGTLADQTDLGTALASKVDGVKVVDALTISSPDTIAIEAPNGATIASPYDPAGQGSVTASSVSAALGFSDVTNNENSQVVANQMLYLSCHSHIDIGSEGLGPYAGPNTMSSDQAAATTICNRIGTTVPAASVDANAVLLEVGTDIRNGLEPGVQGLVVKKGRIEVPGVLLTPASAPGTPTEGQVYYDSTGHVLKFRNASTWVDCGGSSGSAWGSITGTLANQTDLNSALAGKASLSGATFTGSVSATNLSGTNTGDEPHGQYDFGATSFIAPNLALARQFIVTQVVGTPPAGPGDLYLSMPTNAAAGQFGRIVVRTIGTAMGGAFGVDPFWYNATGGFLFTTTANRYDILEFIIISNMKGVITRVIQNVPVM